MGSRRSADLHMGVATCRSADLQIGTGEPVGRWVAETASGPVLHAPDPGWTWPGADLEIGAPALRCAGTGWGSALRRRGGSANTLPGVIEAPSLAGLADAGEVPGPRGFLPPYEPLSRLPSEFAAWDRLAEELPARLVTGRIRGDLRRLPLLEVDGLERPPEAERAMLLLSLFAGVYVHASDPPELSLPPPVARPLVALSRRLGRPPVLSHQSLALHNWRRLDPEGPIVLENLAHLQGAHGSTDELWFLTVAVAIEAAGGGVPALAVRAAAAAAAGDRETVEEDLAELAGTIRKITRLTDRTREGCDPHVFYHRVRPQFSGWPAPGVRYEGTDLGERLVLAGGSAAQSPLIQVFDALLSIAHPPAAREVHLDMRRYMSPRHRRFVAAVEADGSVRRFVDSTGGPSLRRAYDTAVAELGELRRVHFVLVRDYVSRQASPGTPARGTGGTDYGAFLGAAREGTERARLGSSGPASS